MTIKNYNINWSEYFKIDKFSPSGIVRFKNKSGRDVKEYFVGTKLFRENGEVKAWVISFQKETYYVHRIIWVLTYGSIDPNLVIDHLDGNPLNNDIENLRLKTIENNARNHRQSCLNTTGFNGVSITKPKVDYIYYVAHWFEINGIRKSKRFSILKLGEETAKALAIAYREEQIKRLISEGADYTERHGV